MKVALYKLRSLLLQSVKNLIANPLLNLATVFIITVSLFVVGTFAWVLFNLEQAARELGDDPRISAYLNDSVLEDDALVLKARLEARDEVAEVVYISKDVALTRFKQSFEAVAGVLDDLGENPLPASLEITLKGELPPEEMQAFVSALGPPTFEEVDWGAGWADRLAPFLGGLKAASFGLGLLLLVASTLMIANTIHLTVYARREELSIQRLVGATGIFIRLPFVLEGLFQGVMGAGLSIAGLYLTYLWARGPVGAWLHVTLGARDLLFLPPDHLWGFIAVGAFVAVSGNLMSVQRYLRQPVVKG